MRIKLLDSKRQLDIQQNFHLPYLAAKVLASKQLCDEEIKELLASPILSDPFQAKGIQEAADRIYLAKQQKEKVLVCGDYDADGICATAIMVDALQRYGVNAGFYIPNRFKEGYGLQVHTVEMAKQKGYSLLITVDNGVKAFDALKKAKELELDVIVSDHHAMEEDFPCFCLLHPQLMGEQFSTLSGAGVALTLARALIGDVEEHIVYACVAAIADVMTVKKETRAIIKLGLQYLRKGAALPIQMLANDRYPRWNETLIAFQIVPKLNATGRLADLANANNTVRYLLLHNREDISRMAKQICDLNDKRKAMSDEMVETARSLVHDEYDFQLLFHESFHEGMVGIVAGKLQEELQKPVMVATLRDHTFKGSIRSGKLLDLTDFFQGCKQDLTAYGGHVAAAGIGFPFEKKQNIQDYVNNRMKDIQLQKEIVYEAVALDSKEISMQEVEGLSMLAPFGNGFEEPLFFLQNQDILEEKLLKKGIHRKWLLKNNVEAMYFNCQDMKECLSEGAQLSLLGNLRINTFLKKRNVSLFVVEAFDKPMQNEIEFDIINKTVE